MRRRREVDDRPVIAVVSLTETEWVDALVRAKAVSLKSLAPGKVYTFSASLDLHSNVITIEVREPKR